MQVLKIITTQVIILVERNNAILPEKCSPKEHRVVTEDVDVEEIVKQIFALGILDNDIRFEPLLRRLLNMRNSYL